MKNVQVGDLIRITGECDADLKVGDIAEVSDCNATDSGVFVKGGYYVRHVNYEIHRKAGEEDSTESSSETIKDNVNSPNHYTQGRVEVIDIIEDAVQGADPFEAVCQANILKYTLRYRTKNGIEDLKKSRWYLDKLITHEQRKIDGK